MLQSQRSRLVGAIVIASLAVGGAVVWLRATGPSEAALRHLGVFHAYGAAMGILGLAGVYTSLFVIDRMSPADLFSIVLLLAISVALVALYPRGQRAGYPGR